MPRITAKTIVPLLILVLLFSGAVALQLLVPEPVINEFVASAGPLGPIVLILCVWLTNFLAPLSGSPFIFAGYILFGKSVILYTYISALLASISNFLVAKRWGRQLVERLAGRDALQKIDELSLEYGTVTLIFMRVLLGSFHDVISYAYGLTAMKFWPYFIITAFGMIPSIIVWGIMSWTADNPISFTLPNLAIAWVSLGAYFLWLKYSKRKPTKD